MKKCQIASDTEVMWDITPLENNCGSSTDFKCPCLGLSLKTRSLWPLVACGLSLLNQKSWLCNSSVGLTVRALVVSHPAKVRHQAGTIQAERTLFYIPTRNHVWKSRYSTPPPADSRHGHREVKRSRHPKSLLHKQWKVGFFFNYWVMRFLRRERRFKRFKLRFNWTFNKDLRKNIFKQSTASDKNCNLTPVVRSLDT